MPPRDPQLPDGTDRIVNGETSNGEGGGFVATGKKDDTGGERATDRMVAQVRDQVATLRGQATDKLLGLADDGKGKATGLLGDIAEIIEDAARSIDERLGADYGEYAHRASGAVSSFAGKVRDKSVDEIVGDTRSIVRKSPAVAIAAAAVVGFALMRVVRTGLDDSSSRGEGKPRRSRARSSNAPKKDQEA